MEDMVEVEGVVPPGHLSFSTMDLFSLCPHAVWLEKFLKVPRTTVSPALVEGLSHHGALEVFNREKMKGNILKPQDMEGVFLDVFDRKRGEITEWEEETPDKIVERARVFQKGYIERYAPRITPLRVEQKITGKVGGQKVVGVIDLIGETPATPCPHPPSSTSIEFQTEDGDPREGEKVEEVIDYKVTTRAKSEGDLLNGVQMGIYSLLSGKKDVSFVCFVKTKEPKIVRVRGRRTEKSLEKVKNYVHAVSRTIMEAKEENFPMCPPDSWKCSPKWCGVWHACKQGGGNL